MTCMFGHDVTVVISTHNCRHLFMYRLLDYDWYIDIDIIAVDTNTVTLKLFL